MSVTINNTSGITYGLTVEMITTTCPSCGILHSIPVRFKEKAAADGKTLHCPNGHTYWFGESEADRLKKQLAAKESELADKQTRVKYWNDKYHSELNSKRTLKGHHTRLKNKIQQGMCPCCDQNFSDLAAHMVNEHPDFTTNKDH